MSKKKTGFGLRMAFGGETPSALERRLNDRLNNGTLTVRGAAMLSDIENQRRGNATQRYGIDTQAGTARMNDATQRYGVDTQAGTARYGIDTQAGTARMNDATQRYGIGTQADTARYGVDAQSATARMNDATQRYGVDTQAGTARYGDDTRAGTAKYGVDAQTAIANMTDATTRFGMGLNADTQRYGMDSSLLGNLWRMKDGGEIQPRLGLRNGGEIHAAYGFAPGGFAGRASSVKWLSPRDQMDYQAKMAGVDADLALKEEQLRQAQESFVSPQDLKDKEARDRYYQQQAAHKNQAIDEKRYQDKLGLEKQRADMEKQRFDREMAASAMTGRNGASFAMQNAQLDLDMKKAQLAEYNKARLMQTASPDVKALYNLGAAGGGNGYMGISKTVPQVDPQEAQDSARLNERRNMYDKALRGHFNAGGFGASRPGALTATKGVRGFGLRNGGDMLQTGMGGVVPGTGKGDKIPAKYEPGEFVVSNDMLAAEPELRDHLRELRERVLAAKGMTPEQADAKAIQVEGGGKEQKAGKKGFGIRAYSGGDYVGSEGRGDSGTTFADTVIQAEEERKKRAAELAAAEAAKFEALTSNPDFDVPPAAKEKLQAQRASQQVAAKNAHPAQNAATPEEMSTAFDSRSIATTPAAKDAPAVLQGATGKDVGFGVTRFNVPGQSPLFTNMTDEAGMRSNDALISRKPQSDQDRIAGDNLSNRFAQRADAEARMAQRQAELQAEYERGQVDNRAIASSERQRELLNEQRNLERKIPNKEEAAGVNARIAALEKARLGEGENFGARENALVLDQARNDATIGVHAGDRASIERVADKELAAKSPGYALDNELSRQKIAQGQALQEAQRAYADAVQSGDTKAIETAGRYLSALTGKNANGEWKALPGARYTDENGVQHVTNPMMYHTGDGRDRQIGGNDPVQKALSDPRVAAIKNNASMTRDQKIAALKQLGY